MRQSQWLPAIVAGLSVFVIGMGAALVVEAGGASEAPSNAAQFMFESVMEGQETGPACDQFAKDPSVTVGNWASWGVNRAGIREMTILMTELCTVSA